MRDPCFWAAVLACAASSAGARAEILYQDLRGLAVTQTYSDVSIDMNLDGIAEVFARYYAECDIFPIHEYASVYVGTAVDRAFLLSYPSMYLRGLPEGATIGSGSTYKATGALLYGEDELCDGSMPYFGGDWRGSIIRDVGVRVDLVDGPHYGWVRIENQTGRHDSFRVLECAMETRPGVAITAGNRGGCPQIQKHPQPTHAGVGHDVTLSVVASGYVTSYVWLRDGVPVVDDGRVSGATTRELTIKAATREDVARYSVRASGPCGTVVSDEAALWVDPECRPAPGWEMAVDGGVAVIGDSPDLRPTTQMTTELWFNPEATNTNPILAAKGGRDWCSNHSWTIEYDGAAIFPVPFIIAQVTFAAGPKCKYAYVVAATGTPNRWTHLAMTVDTQAGVLRAYVDGYLTAYTTTCADGSPIQGLSIAQTNWPLSVGRVTQNGVPVAEPFQGRIDNVRVWNVAKSIEEIEASYAAGAAWSADGSAMALSFDDPHNPGEDVSGNGNAATLLPGTWLSESIVCCQADVDASGFADTDDFTLFIGLYESGDIRADFDRSGFVDTDDFTAFIVAFEAGC